MANKRSLPLPHLRAQRTAQRNLGNASQMVGTNQQVLNFFMFAFGRTHYWQKIEQCGLQSLAVPSNNRHLAYRGLDIEQLNLVDDEKQMLLEMLQPVG